MAYLFKIDITLTQLGILHNARAMLPIYITDSALLEFEWYRIHCPNYTL